MPDDELKARLDELAARLARVEQHLQIAAEGEGSSVPAALPPITSTAPSIVEETLLVEPVEPAVDEPPVERPEELERARRKLDAFHRRAEQWSSSAGEQVAPDAPVPAPIVQPPPSITGAPPPPLPLPPPSPPVLKPPRPADALVSLSSAPPTIAATPRAPVARDASGRDDDATSARSNSWEVLIGGKWMAWAGALVVVLAAAFAVKIGIDQGVWGRIPPLARCLIIAGCGGLLLVGGELALRRIGRPAAVGLFGAGLGTLYLDAFATFRFFNLLEREPAFVLMALVALGGFAITYRTRFLTIGILSMIGGYLTPLLLRGQRTHDVELLAYFTMLLGVSLALSAIMPRPFRPMRYVALGLQALVALSWLIANAGAKWELAIVFMSAWWAMVIVESLYAAVHDESALGNAAASVIATALFVTAGCWVLNAASPAASAWLGAFTGMVALVAAATALNFGPGIDALREPPRSALDKFAVALWAQAAVLLAVAIALQFKGFAESVGWLAVALASIETARRLPSRGVATFGLIVGAAALVRVFAIDWWITPGFANAIWRGPDVDISRWSLLAIGAALATHVAAQRTIMWGSGALWRQLPVTLATLATAMLVIIALAQCDNLTLTAAWLALAAALLALERVGRRQRYYELGFIVLCAAAVKWLALDALAERLERGWQASAALPVVNVQMALAVVIAAMGWWTYRITRRRELEGVDAAERGFAAHLPAQIAIIVGAVFALIALSFEIDRAVERAAAGARALAGPAAQLRQLMFTLLWAAGSTALGVLAIALWRRAQAEGEALESAPPRLLLRFAWSVLIICAIKWVGFDSLFFAIAGNQAPASPLPVANAQMLVAIVLATSFIVLLMASRRPGAGTAKIVGDETTAPPWRLPGDAGSWAPVAAGCILLWGLSFEVDRALGRFDSLPGWLAAWDSLQLRGLFCTALWAIGGYVMLLVGRARAMPALLASGWAILIVSAAAWLSFDTLTWRVVEGVADVAPFVNLQFGVGALVMILLFAVAAHVAALAVGQSGARDQLLAPVAISIGIVVIMGLWQGSLEIDRIFDVRPMVKQAMLSGWWGVYAVGLVLTGFARRVAIARYAGLALLSITALKVLFIDFAHLDNLPRVASFAAAGLLLIGTSIAYAKLSPKLLAAGEEK